MTSPFESLPYEILVNIVACLSDSKNDLCEFQLASKRCRSLAEKHLFKELILPDHVTGQYRPFSENPQRCSYVRILQLNGEPSVALDSSFFNKFCNIEIVRYDPFKYMFSWQYFNETFTRERCRLREMPHPLTDINDVEPYIDALENHSPHLEKLEFAEAVAPLSSLLINFISLFCHLPKLKSLSFSWVGQKIQDWDAVIDRYPLLEELEVALDTEEEAAAWTPTTQHQRLMKRVSYRSSPTNFDSMRTYFTAKFSNVRKWETANYLSYEEEIDESKLASFEDHRDMLHSMMKSPEVKFSIRTDFESISNYFDFLESYGVNTNISIDYSYLVVSDPFLADLIVVGLCYSRTQSNLNEATLKCEADVYDHSLLLEQYGQHVRKLKLILPEGEYDEEEDEMIENPMIMGGAFTHLLDNCPELTTLDYQAITLCPLIDFEGKVHKNLKKAVLQCACFEDGTLESISKGAPNIEDLTIVGDLSDSFIDVDMPENNFERLLIVDNPRMPFGRWEFKQGVLVDINLKGSDTIDYYLQMCDSNDAGEPPVKISKDEHKKYSMLSDMTNISVTCSSIKYLEYALTNTTNSTDYTDNFSYIQLKL